MRVLILIRGIGVSKTALKQKDGKGYIKYDYFIVRAKDAQSRDYRIH